MLKGSSSFLGLRVQMTKLGGSSKAEHISLQRLQVIPNTSLFATCSADGTVKIWDWGRMEKKTIANRSRQTYARMGVSGNLSEKLSQCLLASFTGSLVVGAFYEPHSAVESTVSKCTNSKIIALAYNFNGFPVTCTVNGTQWRKRYYKHCGTHLFVKLIKPDKISTVSLCCYTALAAMCLCYNWGHGLPLLYQYVHYILLSAFTVKRLKCDRWAKLTETSTRL